MSKVVIIDIDGTVAEKTDRHIFNYKKVLTDSPKAEVIEVVNSFWKSGYKIIFLSGRPDSCFDDTYQWLSLNCPPFIKLLMRKTGDNRKDAEIKKEIYFNEIESNFDVLCVLDDRNQVVDMWREIGLTCLQVAPGDF
jgi:hydroxymethylpyrimidine pyrophosphatase-like HAD family hydrolase